MGLTISGDRWSLKRKRWRFPSSHPAAPRYKQAVRVIGRDMKHLPACFATGLACARTGDAVSTPFAIRLPRRGHAAKQARAPARQTEAQGEADDAALAQRIAGRLEAAGVSTDQVATFCGAVAGTPGAFAAIRAEITPQNPMAEASPMAHALRMFVSYLFAGAAPVVPFALPPLEEERILSVVVTIALLLALGVGRWLWPGGRCCAPRSRRCSSPPQRPLPGR